MSHSQLLVLFLLTAQSFSIYGCKEYNQSDFSVDHLVMSMYRSSLVLLEEDVCYDQCIFLAKLYQSLPCFIPYSKATFDTPMPNPESKILNFVTKDSFLTYHTQCGKLRWVYPRRDRKRRFQHSIPSSVVSFKKNKGGLIAPRLFHHTSKYINRCILRTHMYIPGTLQTVQQ